MNAGVEMSATEAHSVGLIGLGNIGGFAAELAARLPGVESLVLADRDAYETRNVCAQNITTCEVGRAKALVQAERACRINPKLRVTAIVDDIESMPLGLLRTSVLLAGLDSRRARQCVNQAAWRLGLPWIDAGVRADGLLARVNVYRPGADQPCLECPWDQRDYDGIEQTYACGGDATVPTATNAPASLGALAAALQVLECQKLLAGQWDSVAVAKQLIIDANGHKQLVSSLRPNSSCRFDHAIWHIDRLESDAHHLRIGEAFALGSLLPGGATGLRIEGRVFVKKLTCRCGETRELFWKLSGRLGDARRCVRCQRPMQSSGLDAREWLREKDLSPEEIDQPFANFGFRSGDIFTLRSADGERHFELGAGDTADSAAAEAPQQFGACG